ncbi:MAG: response regulator [Lachnospiraceae bacterium]|nr:response regulator [Lachnospiraceae bacterium]
MPLQLLIIDDSELNLKLTELMISKIDCHADTFSDVREALRSVKDHDYDLVFMDYLMPDINGIEATRLIRSMSGGIHTSPNYYQNLPIIALTAEDDTSMQKRMKENGINDVLLKPFKLDNVCAMIDKWCGTSLSSDFSRSDAVSVPSDMSTGTASSLPRINGIADDTLQDMLHIDREGFLDTLTIFTEDTPGKHKRIDEALSSEDYETYCVEVHRIKGEAAIIGAYALSEDAAHLNELGKILLKKELSPSGHEEKLGAITAGTSLLFKQLDELCVSARDFLTANGWKCSDDNMGVLTSLTRSHAAVPARKEKDIDRDKLIRYVSHAKEALDNGDTALAKEWLTEISDYIKQ